MSAIENLFHAFFQIFEGIFNAILSVFQGSIHLTTSVVSHILGFFWDIVAFVLHNAVVIGVVVAALVGYQAFVGRQRVGAKKRL